MSCWKVKNTYYVALLMSNCWLMGGACGLDLKLQNQICNALSTCGRKDSRLRLVLRTLPASTMSFSLDLCFFHVDKVDGLKLNSLQIFTPLIPQSNLCKMSSFSFSVRSVCWRLGLEKDILLCTVPHWHKRQKTAIYSECSFPLKQKVYFWYWNHPQS